MEILRLAGNPDHGNKEEMITRIVGDEPCCTVLESLRSKDLMEILQMAGRPDYGNKGQLIDRILGKTASSRSSKPFRESLSRSPERLWLPRQATRTP